MIKFPDNFLWGSAISAYQVEGGINKSDWSSLFPADQACDHYNRYEEDFDLLENQKVFRFSIEWSRIEPSEGEFSEKEIEHYRNYLKSLKKRGIKTMVTLHHFTSPTWFFDKKSWTKSDNVQFFVRFALRMLEEYHDLVDFWITINEPLIYCSKSFLVKDWPGPSKGVFAFIKAVRNQIKAHKAVYKAFHERKDVEVGLSKNNQFFQGVTFVDKIVCSLSRYLWNRYFLNQIRKEMDFIGINYYFHRKIKFLRKKKSDNVTDLGWDICPEGIYWVLMENKRYNLPIYITENGLADSKDEKRISFIRDHLIWVKKAIEDQVDVKGYCHWSLIDNFEWDKGFNPRFGLVEIDYRDLSRSKRPSFSFYNEICLNNGIK